VICPTWISWVPAWICSTFASRRSCCTCRAEAFAWANNLLGRVAYVVGAQYAAIDQAAQQQVTTYAPVSKPRHGD
jgi:hypothetical protein